MSVWVFTEEVDGGASQNALELVSKARTLGDVHVMYVGAGSEEAFADQMTCAVARTLAGYGCDTEEVRDDVRDVLDLLAKYG